MASDTSRTFSLLLALTTLALGWSLAEFRFRMNKKKDELDRSKSDLQSLTNGGKVLLNYDQPQEPHIATYPRHHVRTATKQTQANTRTTSQICCSELQNIGATFISHFSLFKGLIKVVKPYYVTVSQTASKLVIPNMYQLWSILYWNF